LRSFKQLGLKEGVVKLPITRGDVEVQGRHAGLYRNMKIF